MKLLEIFIQKVEAGGVQYTNIYNPTAHTGVNTFGQIFTFAFNVIFGVGWGIVLVMTALGFMQFILSRGEKVGTDQAQKWLTYAVVGGVVLFLITVVRTVLPNTLGTTPGDIDTGIGGGVTL